MPPKTKKQAKAGLLAMELSLIKKIVPLDNQDSLDDLYQNATLPKETRVSQTFNQALKQFDANFKDNLTEDAELIELLFPSASKQLIKTLLKFFGGEPNRVRICVRFLIVNNENNNDGFITIPLFVTPNQEGHHHDDGPNQVDPAFIKSERGVNKRKSLGDNGRRKRRKSLLLPCENQNVKPSTSRDISINTPLISSTRTSNIGTNLQTATNVEEAAGIMDLTEGYLDDNNDVIFEKIDLTDEIMLLDNKLLSGVMEIFPSADPNFLRGLCKYEKGVSKDLNQIIDYVFSMEDYPKREMEEETEEIDYEQQLEILKQVLPDADPSYLEERLSEIFNQKDLKFFISEAIDSKNYPKYSDALRREQLSAQARQYTSEFNVEKFLELFPNPEEFFHPNSKRKFAEDCVPRSPNYYSILNFLKNHYKRVNIRHITNVLDKTLNVFKACKILDHTKEGLMLSARKTVYAIEDNIPMLQLFAYLEHKTEILDYKDAKEKLYTLRREQAKKDGLMLCCQCCFDEEIMPEDIITCPNGCTFCRECIQRAVEVAFGNGILEYDCLAGCDSKFTLQILQSALKPKLFSKLAQKKQMEEVKAAGIEDLEQCPFCEFATIPPMEDKIFKCLNSDCMKESCRNCKEPSHLPLHCDEVEKDSDVEKRTYIENKMTEALLRTCWKCNLKFIKADGCNKMTCSCGAMLCYICKKPVKDYSHFNGQGGTRYDLCPLYSDTNLLHQQDVLQGAAEAKNKVGNEVKVDPTADIREHYEEIAKKNPIVLPPGVVLQRIEPR